MTTFIRRIGYTAQVEVSTYSLGHVTISTPAIVCPLMVAIEAGIEQGARVKIFSNDNVTPSYIND